MRVLCSSGLRTICVLEELPHLFISDLLLDTLLQECKMDPEEQELLSDYRYRNYSSVIEKALRNFESSSEWADLISSLGKLNKVCGA